MTEFAYKRYANVETEDGHLAVHLRLRADSGYRESDRLCLVWTGVVQVNGESCDAPAALGILWNRHNADNRPDGHLGPSLSVGDVIVLLCNRPGETPTAFACENLGWREVPVPTTIDHRFWVEAIADAQREPTRLNDTAALNAIHSIMSGNEWSAGTIEEVANLVVLTGREIEPPKEDV